MESKKRSMVKGITWKILSQLMTVIILYAFTRNITFSIGITIIGTIVSYILYFIHERAWDRVKWGRYK